MVVGDKGAARGTSSDIDSASSERVERTYGTS